jgi:uncharacterized membrane protein
MKPNRILLALALFVATCAQAAPADFLKEFETQARAESAAFKGFSAERGSQFYHTKHGAEWSCASCHTDTPTATGKHAKTDKEIKPLAPSANAERFTDAAKVEKWFKRNCGDVLNRACTAQEKGDFLTYVISVRK